MELQRAFDVLKYYVVLDSFLKIHFLMYETVAIECYLLCCHISRRDKTTGLDAIGPYYSTFDIIFKGLAANWKQIDSLNGL